MSEEIKETLDDIKRHLDYVEATKQSSIRDNEIKIMHDYIISLQQKVEQLEKENKQLRTQVNTYENPDDLTLFYMWLDEKAKDKIKQLENIRKEAIKVTKDMKQFVYDELVDRNVSGATETHCKIMDLLNILNKGE